LAVSSGGEPFVLVDTASFAVRDPAATPEQEPGAEPGADPGGRNWWVPTLTLAGVAFLLLLALLGRGRGGAREARPSP
jgi:hypothetical protein